MKSKREEKPETALGVAKQNAMIPGIRLMCQFHFSILIFEQALKLVIEFAFVLPSTQYELCRIMYLISFDHTIKSSKQKAIWLHAKCC